MTSKAVNTLEENKQKLSPWKWELDFPAQAPIYVREEPKLCDRDITELVPVQARFQTEKASVIRRVMQCPVCGAFFISRGYYEYLTEGFDRYTFIPAAAEADAAPQGRQTKKAGSTAGTGWAITHPCQGGVCSGK